MEPTNTSKGYFSYIKGCFTTIKNTITEYQKYSCRYDPYQKFTHVMDVKYSPHYHAPRSNKFEYLLAERAPRNKRIKTMAHNVADSIKHTFFYGAFALTSYILTDQNKLDQMIYYRTNTRSYQPRPESDYSDDVFLPEFDDNYFNNRGNAFVSNEDFYANYLKSCGNTFVSNEDLNVNNGENTFVSNMDIDENCLNNGGNTIVSNENLNNNGGNTIVSNMDIDENYFNYRGNSILSNTNPGDTILSNEDLNENYFNYRSNITTVPNKTNVTTMKNTNHHQQKNEQQRIPIKRTFDDTWCFVYKDLSSQNKNAFVPIAPKKPPRRKFRQRQ